MEEQQVVSQCRNIVLLFIHLSINLLLKIKSSLVHSRSPQPFQPHLVNMNASDTVLIVFAAIFIAEMLLNVLGAIYRYLLRYNLNLVVRYGNKLDNTTPAWAAVTGATSALGFDYVCEFAAR